MKDPSYQKLENLIDRMVDERVNEGQLSKTPLTFQDIHTIKETFLNILVGIYHSRVEYPDDQKDQKEEKSAEQVKKGKKHIPEHPEAPESPPRVDEYYNS